MSRIPGGAFLVARKVFDSDIWTMKPSTWFKMWIYILGNVNFVDSSTLKRGQGYFNFKREKHDIGQDITDDSTKKFMQFARGCGLITTKRSTRGVVVSVLNYDSYQNLSSYEAPQEALEAHQTSTRGAPRYHKNDKNERIKNVKSVGDDVALTDLPYHMIKEHEAKKMKGIT